jgi:putative ABC transport system permease protein
MTWSKSKRPRDPQLDSELRFHLEQLTNDNIASGMSPREARRKAILEFGGQEQIKEELRDVYRRPLIDTAFANLKSAFRFIRKSPSFSLTVLLTLALSIGANSAVFSAIDAILLRPLPFPEGDQLMALSQVHRKVKNPEGEVAPVRLEDWNRMSSTFQAIAGYDREDASEASGPLPEKLTELVVSPRFLQVWGIAPEIGRDFNSEEGRFGGPDAVLISNRLWRRRFRGASDVLGKKLRINGYWYSIIGVMPASFSFPERDADLWTPNRTDAPYAQSRAATWFTVVGRLKPGVSLEEARANMATVQAQLGATFPGTDADLGVAVEPLKEATVGGVRRSLWILFGSVTLLLLIACTNVVALLLSRGAQRRHEISVRFSLGASRVTLVIQLLTEAFVLALSGAVLGLMVAGAASAVFRVLARDLPRVEEIHLNWMIVLYALVCSVAVTLLCGLLPALVGTRGSLSGTLAQTGRTQVSGHSPLQWLLVGVQVALAVTLLAGAGLLLRSFQELGRVSPGFDPTHVLTFHVSASWGETAQMQGLTQRIDRTIDALSSLPGVEAVATAAALPGVPNEYPTELRLVDGPADPNHKIEAESRFISPSYFATMKIPLLEGEPCRGPKFLDQPAPHAPWFEENSLTVVVNRSFANTYLPGSMVVGHRVAVLGNSFLPETDTAEIRGIVGDAREEGMDRAPGPTVYWCISAPEPDPYYLARTHGEPMVMAQTIRQELHQLEPARSMFEIMPLGQRLDDAFAENRLRTMLLTFFAITAVSLASIGLYGTLSYSVTVRQREIGLRLALGALQRQILGQFLLQGVLVTLVGCLVGWGLAAGFTRLLSGMLFGVSPSDAATLSAAVILMLVVATLAALVPALRAAHVDPMDVLREE